MALVLVLLFTAIILGIVVSTTATITLGARTGGVNERTSYQAVLVAESGLNTFIVRVKEAGAFPPTNDAALDTWKTKHKDSLLKYTTPTGTAQLDLKVKSSGELVLTSQGTAYNGTKAVLQDLKSKNDPSFNINPDSALKSEEPVKLHGNADVNGEAPNTNTGIVKVARLAKNYVAPVPDANGVFTFDFKVPKNEFIKTPGGEIFLNQGEYVRIGSATYRVENVGNITTKENDGHTQPVQLKLMLGNISNTTIAINSEVQRINSAVSQSVSSPGSPSPLVISVSDPTMFGKGSTIVIDGHSANVVAKDIEKQTISIQWSSTKPTSISEGSLIQKRYQRNYFWRRGH